MRFLFFFLFFYCGIISSLQAEAPVSFTPGDVIHKIESRRGTWIGLKASVELQFQTQKNEKKTCQGQLLYQRLEEAIRLECYVEKKLVFIFKSTDHDFELYLPSHKSVYQGNIFSLEDSPLIESHLRPWDLYRTFKPMLIPPDKSEVALIEDALIGVKVFRTPERKLVARELKVTNEGDILHEVYYSMKGALNLDIKRFDFKKIIPSHSEAREAFPFHVEITAYKTLKSETVFSKTDFIFKNVEFTSELREQDFAFSLPSNVRTIELEDSL